MKIACFGSGKSDVGDPTYDAMMEVGRLLAQKNVLVLTGGFGGAGMEAPARGVKEAGGLSIGYTWRGKQCNPYLSDVVDCSFVSGKELPAELQYGFRLGSLLTADAFIVAANGGPGTMVELMAAINFGAKLWQPPKRIAVLKPSSMKPGWDAVMFAEFQRWGALPEAVEGYILPTSSPATAVGWVLGPRS